MIKFNSAEAGTIVLEINNSSNIQHNIKTSLGVCFCFFFLKKPHIYVYFQAFVCLSLKNIQAQLPILLQKSSLPCARERKLYLNRILKKPNKPNKTKQQLPTPHLPTHPPPKHQKEQEKCLI